MTESPKNAVAPAYEAWAAAFERPGRSTPYHRLVRTADPQSLQINTSLLRTGLRLAIGVSGGADSVALLSALAERSGELGLVLHVAHLHHGLRGAEADADLEFVRALAARLGLPFHQARVDTAAEARAHPAGSLPANESGIMSDIEQKSAESIEEAARRLRYKWFRQLMTSGEVDSVATAHTLDDQAETVLAKFLRGAWTEGLSGIHPVIEFPEGRIVRPLLETTRGDVEAFLGERQQTWREDSSNRHLTFTRNRIRHELLPLLEGWNRRLRQHLSQMAELALDEESWWEAEIARLAPQLILPGRPIRGGGRAAAEGLAIDLTKLAAQPVAVQRRFLRYVAGQLDAAPDFVATEALRRLALQGRAGQKCELAQGLRAERTHRELRLTVGPASKEAKDGAEPAEYEIEVPGEVDAPAFGMRLKIALTDALAASTLRVATNPENARAVLRSWKPGDRVRLRYSGGSRKVKEVLERLKVTGSDRAMWPVLALNGRIIWMRGVELEPEPGLQIAVSPIDT